MGDNKKKVDKPDYKEVRPPIDTGGLTFDQILKGISNINPKTVEKADNEP
jgi:hypothetical protein